MSWQPDFVNGQQDWQRAVHGRHSAPGHGVLYVFALTGRGPYKEEVIETPSSDALLIATLILNQLGERSVTPNIAPVKGPAGRGAAQSRAIGFVSVNEQPIGPTATITDVSQLALRQYEAVYPTDCGPSRRSPVREEGDGLRSAGSGRHPCRFAFESRDDWPRVSYGRQRSRPIHVAGGCCRRRFRCLRVELPAGEHHGGVKAAAGTTGPVASEVRQTVSIADGRNTYLLATFPRSAIGRASGDSPTVSRNAAWCTRHPGVRPDRHGVSGRSCERAESDPEAVVSSVTADGVFQRFSSLAATGQTSDLREDLRPLAGFAGASRIHGWPVTLSSGPPRVVSHGHRPAGDSSSTAWLEKLWSYRSINC